MNTLSSLSSAFLTGGLAVLGAVTLLWLVSLLKRDASIVDVFWGLGFVLVAWVYQLLGGEADPRQWLLLAMVTLWGCRLAIYIGARNHGKGEDYRYQAMRRHHGDRFTWVSYWKVFLLQGLLVMVISLPFLFVLVQNVETGPHSAGWHLAGWRWTDWVGLALWTVGFFFETVGDWQMSRFKANQANQGKVMRTGLWALTRHPNYFGDATVWWGFYFIALGVPGGWWTFPCPLIMTVLLLKVSGVALLEKTIVERRPEYRDYIESTSAFIPWLPRG